MVKKIRQQLRSSTSPMSVILMIVVIFLAVALMPEVAEWLNP